MRGWNASFRQAVLKAKIWRGTDSGAIPAYRLQPQERSAQEVGRREPICRPTRDNQVQVASHQSHVMKLWQPRDADGLVVQKSLTVRDEVLVRHDHTPGCRCRP